RGDDWKQRALTGLLCSVRSLRVDGLDDERLDLRHVEEGRRFVLEHRGPLVQALAKLLLLHERFAKPHVHAALHLALDEKWIDGATDVVSNPHLVQVDEPRPRIGVEVDHTCRVAVRGAWADAGSLVRPGDLRRRIATGAREGSE